MELPTHPEGDDTSTVGPQAPSPARSRWTMVAAPVFGALVVIVILLHLTGVMGPAGN